MRHAKPAPISTGLLAAKGSAAPSSATRENLGPGRIGQAIADAMIRENRPLPGGASRGRGARVNLSVRLDPARHRRLKLASIHLGEPAQKIMILALDAFLDAIADDLQAISRGFLEENGPEADPAGDAEHGP